MGLLPKLVLEVPQRAVPAREEPDPEETAKSGCTVGTLKKMYGVLTELEAVGFTLVDTLLPACDGWLFTLCIKTMKRKKKSGRIIYKVVLRKRTKGYVTLSHISEKRYQSSVSYLAALFSHHEVNDKIVAKDGIYFDEVFSKTTLVL